MDDTESPRRISNNSISAVLNLMRKLCGSKGSSLVLNSSFVISICKINLSYIIYYKKVY